MKLRIDYNPSILEGLVRKMENSPATIKDAVKGAVGSSVMQVHATAVKPGYAPYKTGTLRRSLTFKIAEGTAKVEGAVGSNLVYAAIHEFGGKTGRNHATTIPARRYLGRSVDENRDAIRERFKKLQLLK